MVVKIGFMPAERLVRVVRPGQLPVSGGEWKGKVVFIGGRDEKVV